ncbi:hypothetical protein R5R35_006228 [Gryllus longicercus]|uniref:Accessory gland protein n=1 Tax=Gryllus longicercus TaxID=2509291 RepID=A0AAN9ZHV2_9ORTH
MQLQGLFVALCIGVSMASPNLRALQARRRGLSAPTVTVSAAALQGQAVCAFTLQERSLQLQGGVEVQVQEVVCEQQKPRLRLGLRDAAAGTAAGPLRLSCMQAQMGVGEHVVRSDCVLVQDDLQAAGDPRPQLAS